MVSLDRDLLIDKIWHNYINGKQQIDIYGTIYGIYHGSRDGFTDILCDSRKYRIHLVIPYDRKSYFIISKHSTEEIIYEDCGSSIPEYLLELLKC